MKRVIQLISIISFLSAVIGMWVPKVVVGAEHLPDFSLTGLDGHTYDTSTIEENALAIIYFFDPGSRPSQEGIMWLTEMVSKYEGSNLVVWAITTAKKEKVMAMLNKIADIGFPVLIDDKGISRRLGADIVLPTVFLVGPGRRVLDKIQGGGRGLEVMVVRIAERELQRKNYQVAKEIAHEVVAKDPSNIKAHVVAGYAELKAGKLDRAEEIFSSVSKRSGEGEILGKEGLAAVYAHKGETKKAIETANKVLEKAPRRALPHVIKGNVFYSKGERKKAQEEFEAAVKSPDAEPYQQGMRFNQLGRLYASVGEYERARELYDKAVDIDPYYVEGMANKGVTYEKEGKWDKALEAYRRALKMDPRDSLTAFLAKKAEEILAIQRDTERSKRIDRLVKELAKRYKEQSKLPPPEDQWTSPPMVLTFLGFDEYGMLSERDGLSIFFTSKLSDYLNASGRVKVVERVILDKLLQELNIGSSELADKETALRLGRILAARLMGMGSFYYLPGSTLLTMRLVDTETSRVRMVETRSLDLSTGMERDIMALNRKILKEIINDYPLRGYVVEKEGPDRVMINIGARQGVVKGTLFEVIEEGRSIIYKGKTLKTAPRKKGIIKVVQVETDLSYAKILDGRGSIRKDDKIQEVMGDGAE